jgi:hypothetical protein
VSRRFAAVAQAAGVPPIKLHEARHSAISLMPDAGVDRDVRMREAGHADAEVADRYTHVLDAAQRAAAQQVADLVAKAGTEHDPCTDIPRMFPEASSGLPAGLRRGCVLPGQ